jgi:hypothetical protein
MQRRPTMSDRFADPKAMSPPTVFRRDRCDRGQSRFKFRRIIGGQIVVRGENLEKGSHALSRGAASLGNSIVNVDVGPEE